MYIVNVLDIFTEYFSVSTYNVLKYRTDSFFLTVVILGKCTEYSVTLYVSNTLYILYIS